MWEGIGSYCGSDWSLRDLEAIAELGQSCSGDDHEVSS